MFNEEINSKLVMMQLGDSFFPSGSFTLSHGLEFLVQSDRITNGEELTIFLRLLLRNKIATCDLVALIHSYRGSQQNDLELVRQADHQLFAQTLIETTRLTQRQSGRALLMVAQSTWKHHQLEILDHDLAQGEALRGQLRWRIRDHTLNQFNCLHPVIFGVVGSIAGLKETDTMLAFLHSFVTGLLGAAIRLNVIGHLEAQQILLHLAPDLEMTCDRAAGLGLDNMSSCTPAIDLAQMRHRQLASRLFAS
jgi:urease accessory protein